MKTLLSVLSGVLLCLCYPTLSWSWLAWIALVPLLVSIHSTSRMRTVLLTWFSGFIFFTGSLHFLTFVDFAAWPALALLESLYWILLGFLFFEVRQFSSRFFRILGVALSFTAIEFLRSEIPVWGFGLNLISHSQAYHPAMIQVASVGGAYLLSFCIVFANASLAEYLIGKKCQRFLIVGALLIALFVFLFGAKKLNEYKQLGSEMLRVSVIQPNIPQSVKWALMAKKDVIEIHQNLTKLAALREPELIIWPEASFPGYLNADYDSGKVFELARSAKAPILVGSPYWESETRVFNSAFLIDESGSVTGRYDKIKLVPFGEYIPWKFILGWLTPIAHTMGVGNFTPGDHVYLFKWKKDLPFAVLICFEDVFSDLARKAVNQGARFLTVITNDAWFGPTGAPWQHLQSSIFRAVENGVPVIRSANTGVSGFISAEGKILNLVRDKQNQSVFTGGELTFEVPMAHHDTLYRRGGWLFPHACVIFLSVLCFLKRKGVLR